jgi:hypothetical protein
MLLKRKIFAKHEVLEANPVGKPVLEKYNKDL